MRNKNLLLALLLALPAWAQNTANKGAKSNVLDFEGEVIEGEKRRPDLFMQTNTQDLTLDNILYQRNDFNDFLSVEAKRRPRHYKIQKHK